MSSRRGFCNSRFSIQCVALALVLPSRQFPPIRFQTRVKQFKMSPQAAAFDCNEKGVYAFTKVKPSENQTPCHDSVRALLDKMRNYPPADSTTNTGRILTDYECAMIEAEKNTSMHRTKRPLKDDAIDRGCVKEDICKDIPARRR